MRATIAYELPTEDGYPMGHSKWEVEASFKQAVKAFRADVPDADDPSKWHYVQIVWADDLDRYYCGNNGAQGWRHRETGLTIPDWCRQSGGCPELWTQAACEEARHVDIDAASPIYDHLKD